MYAGAAVLLRQHPSDCTFVRRYAKRSTTPRRRSPNFCARNAPWNAGNAVSVYRNLEKNFGVAYLWTFLVWSPSPPLFGID